VTRETKTRLIARLGSWIMRVLFWTLRFRFIDRAGVLTDPPREPLLWAFWHNRLLVSAYMFERYFPTRRGAAMASRSKDGEIISAIIDCFGLRPIRGSSSRGGARALVEMKRAHDDGYDVAITPDGPRGPKYHVNPGIVKLAQLTGGKIFPMHNEYSRCWRLKSWDGFMIPKPFATVEITFDELHLVPPTETEEEFEYQRRKFEEFLRPQRGK
jgi:lysophospholipid acyltransferase (LPLAT)-like uncharacterized protein